MSTPKAVPFRGRARWDRVVLDLVLAALGGLASWLLLAAIPASFVPARIIAGYTAYASVVTLALALALALTRQLPTIRPARHRGEEAVGVRAWPGEWWHANALDLGLAVTGAALAVLGIQSGVRDLLVVGVLVGLVGAWFLGRVLLSVVGRRRNHALWLTASAVVHEAPWGTERCSRDSVVDVRASGGSVVLLLEAPADRQETPLPWRRRRSVSPLTIVVDCSMMGHEAADLAAWLRSELTTDPLGFEPGRVTRHDDRAL